MIPRFPAWATEGGRVHGGVIFSDRRGWKRIKRSVWDRPYKSSRLPDVSLELKREPGGRTSNLGIFSM